MQLLIELRTEELPPRALETMSQAFAQSLESGLRELGLLGPDAHTEPIATPRRLGVHIKDVLTAIQPPAHKIKLLPLAIGKDAQGNASQALLKKLTELHTKLPNSPTVETMLGSLETVHDGKHEQLVLTYTPSPLSLSDALQALVDKALQHIPIPKVMRYQLADGQTTIHFVRPVRSVIALIDEQVLPLQVFGLQSGRTTQGHRFAALCNEISIRHASQYKEQMLHEGNVLVNFSQRHAYIEQQLQQAAAALNLTLYDYAEILDEVCALTEYPVVLQAEFAQKYLQIPAECLILTMQRHQRYFPLLDQSQKLSHYFLLVSNCKTDHPEAVIKGNERVLSARLADAAFFYQQDLKQALIEREALMQKVIYQHQLGAMDKRIERITSIALILVEQIGGISLEHVKRAARLAKLDLVTHMIGEFPELQGTMGYYYALASGESIEVAEAIQQHYLPRFAGDKTPRQRLGQLLAIADKVELLLGMFSIKVSVSGDKDPYGLRRAALGVLRIAIENSIDFDLSVLLQQAAKLYQQPDLAEQVKLFILDRARAYLREQTYAMDQIEAVLAHPEASKLMLIPKRLQALAQFVTLNESHTVIEADKRLRKIIAKSKGIRPIFIDNNDFSLPAELALLKACQNIQANNHHALVQGDFPQALLMLTRIAAPIDKFFTDVMVMCDDLELRNKRLNLLMQVHQLLSQIADLSKLQVLTPTE